MGNKSNPLRELGRFGVSVWYDNISRSLISTGKLASLIKDDGVTGVTSNPTIFEKAIGGSTDYDDTILARAREGKSSMEIFESLAIEDIRAACDLFKPVFEATKGDDGYVSLELAPSLARDAAGSRAEASRLFKLVARPNLMIKIPGTKEGVEAFEGVTADGIPVNVTLLFSQERYAEVAEAYLRGLEKRAEAGHDLRSAASVASFFVSRVDSTIDGKLKGKGKDAEALMGKAAIANAKLAYQIYKKEFFNARFAALKAKGARVQRLLWASTSTKNPAYRDVIYVEELIGADTVNTMPPNTVDAFRDHGQCRPALEQDVEQARAQWAALKGFGVNVAEVCVLLEEEGLASFSKSFETLLGQIAAKRELIEAEAGVVDAGLAKLEKALFSGRLWAKEPGLWKNETAHQKIVKNSLGWLTAPEAMAAGLGAVRSFAAEVRGEFTDVLVLGMGGSSLCCEVLARSFPSAKGHPRLRVLDTTSPAAVAAMTASLDLGKTLFIVASKSGSTIEPNCLMEHFWAAAQKKSGKAPGAQFVAITDPGTSLEKLARQRGFRKLFTNPADVGGRFSALTLFGLVPAALMGVDVELLLNRARAMAKECGPGTPTSKNPALRLGAALGSHALGGQDKLTLWLSPAVETFGLWIEQLVAESTGKEGKGVVPVVGEPLGEKADAYGEDRLFVSLALDSQPAPAAFGALERAGRPVVALNLKDAYDLGAQFFLWEAATAAAGFLLGVNPFDQPDVQSSKDMTKALLSSLEGGALPAETAQLNAGGLAAFADPALVKALGGRGSAPAHKPLPEALAAHFSRLSSGDYAAILAYVSPDEDNRRAVEAAAAGLRRLTNAPVVVEYGPRYLHSTGQLYKGGSAKGLFLMLVETDAAAVAVPGESFGFGTLLNAQARGDFSALLAAGRRVLRLDLGPAGNKPLQALANAAAAASSAQCRS